MSEKIGASSTDSIVDKITLDIKAFMLLNESDESARREIEDSFLSSHDEQVKRFFELTRRKKRTSNVGNFLIACGDLLIASFLVIAGLGLLAPSVMGFSSPTQLLGYLKSAIDSIPLQAFSSPLVPTLDFVLALVLLLSAFYLLRTAASNLKEFGSTFDYVVTESKEK